MAIWQPPPPNPFIGGHQPLAPETGPPSTLLVDTPPKLYDGWQLNAVRLWDPPPPSPFIGGRQPLAPETGPPSTLLVDTPPKFYPAQFNSIIRAWDPPPPWPVTALDKLIQDLVVAVAANPPYSQTWLWAILNTWQPTIIVPQSRIYLPQSAIVVSVDDPPWGFPPDWLYSVLTSAWKPGDPLPKVLQKILQEGAAPVIASGQREKRKWRRSSS